MTKRTNDAWLLVFYTFLVFHLLINPKAASSSSITHSSVQVFFLSNAPGDASLSAGVIFVCVWVWVCLHQIPNKWFLPFLLGFLIPPSVFTRLLIQSSPSLTLSLHYQAVISSPLVFLSLISFRNSLKGSEKLHNEAVITSDILIFSRWCWLT